MRVKIVFTYQVNTKAEGLEAYFVFLLLLEWTLKYECCVSGEGILLMPIRIDK